MSVISVAKKSSMFLPLIFAASAFSSPTMAWKAINDSTYSVKLHGNRSSWCGDRVKATLQPGGEMSCNGAETPCQLDQPINYGMCVQQNGKQTGPVGSGNGHVVKLTGGQGLRILNGKVHVWANETQLRRGNQCLPPDCVEYLIEEGVRSACGEQC